MLGELVRVFMFLLFSLAVFLLSSELALLIIFYISARQRIYALRCAEVSGAVNCVRAPAGVTNIIVWIQNHRQFKNKLFIFNFPLL